MRYRCRGRTDTLKAPHILEELYEALGTRRAADQTVVQADRHQPGMLGTLLIEQVEGISHVVEDIRGMCEAVTLIAAVVISLVQ